ncbi:MAG: hypothetical protein IGNPGNKH_00719 [Sodalis sp. Ffu]|nr:MAG: hypothetical protein IGNPGNKH_00719 [Sodalis sp. Ffu]
MVITNYRDVKMNHWSDMESGIKFIDCIFSVILTFIAHILPASVHGIKR